MKYRAEASHAACRTDQDAHFGMWVAARRDPRGNKRRAISITLVAFLEDTRMARESLRSSRDNDRARNAAAPARSASSQRAANARANESAYGASAAAGAPAADRERAIQTSRDTARRPASRANASNNAAANARSANARASSNANANAANPSARNNANARNSANANARSAPARNNANASNNANANPNAQRDQPRDRERIPAIYQYAAGLNATPFTLIRRMAEDMDRIFHDYGLASAAPALSAAAARNPWHQSSTYAQSWAPAIETFRRGDRLVIRADLPGLSKNDVKVEVEGSLLSISGERHDEHEEDREDYYRSERAYGRFYRAIPLPDGIQADDCNASFRDGVLEVTLAAPQPGAEARREIRVS
jgi:HSP20 family protein